MTDDQENRTAEPDPERVFRSIRRRILDKYEQEMNQQRDDATAQEGIGRRLDDPLRKIWQDCGLDMAAIDALREAEIAKMNEFIEEGHRRAAARDPQRGPRLREAAERALDLIQMGGSQPYLLGADVVAPTPEQLADYEGHQGNPATWLYDAGANQKVKTSSTGQPGCLGGWEYHPFYAIWYYAWPPVAPALTKCSIQAWCGYHGYYQLLAVPMPPEYCQWAAVTASAELQVYQQVAYPWGKYSKMLGQAKKTFFDKKVASTWNYAASGVLDGSEVLYADVNLTSKSQVYIAVSIKVEAGAQGQPAYAEINFQDYAHYVPPPFVIVSW